MRIVIKTLAWVIGVLVLAAAAILGINATDDELSEAAKRAMVLPPAVPASPGNGFKDVYAMGETGLDTRLKKSCGGLVPDRCLQYAAENQELVKASVAADRFAASYRAMRAKPEFVELYEQRGRNDAIPPVHWLVWGQAWSQLASADRLSRGDIRAALAELEAENAFHRRVVAGAYSLIPKVIALTILQRDAFFASELARLPAARPASVLKRLKAVMRPLPEADLDMRRSLEVERAENISWMRDRQDARLSDDDYLNSELVYGKAETRPWWDPIVPYLYRPNQSVNRYAAQSDILLAVAALPPGQYWAGAEAARARAAMVGARGWTHALVNPVGHDHRNLRLLDTHSPRPDAITPFIGAAHFTRSLYALVSLQIALLEAGVTSRPAMERAMSGPIFAAYPDSLTGKPMEFDAKTRTIGFAAPANVGLGGLMDKVRERYGRVAVEVAGFKD